MLDYSEQVTITITKVHAMGMPSHWEYDVDNGSCGTGSDFYSVVDAAVTSITGDYGDHDSVHNDWVDFDANNGDK